MLGLYKDKVILLESNTQGKGVENLKLWNN